MEPRHPLAIQKRSARYVPVLAGSRGIGYYFGAVILWRRNSMRFRILLAALALSASGAVGADSIDINLNNETVQGTYATKWRAAEFDAGALYNNDRNDWVANAGLLAFGEKDTPQARYEAGVGGKIYGASVDNN